MGLLLPILLGCSLNLCGWGVLTLTTSGHGSRGYEWGLRGLLLGLLVFCAVFTTLVLR